MNDNNSRIKEPQFRFIPLTEITPQLKVENERDKLLKNYIDRIEINNELNRGVVSFQNNKLVPFYRWLKFKEGFSSKLVKYCIQDFQAGSMRDLNILDPFSGAGTTLTTAASLGHQATGIELLPVGTAILKARLMAAKVDRSLYEFYVKQLSETFDVYLQQKKLDYKFPHIRITRHAFSDETEHFISAYIAFLDTIKLEDIKYLFWFACLAILEEISYTSKDGQYLRWDNRSAREIKSKYRKRKIGTFKEAIFEKLNTMFEDIKHNHISGSAENVRLIEGSNLFKLPKLESNQFDLVITSPPYCNRYDYTRTYALELAFLGYNDSQVKELRQELLSATVENRTKKLLLKEFYAANGRESDFQTIEQAFNCESALGEVLDFLKFSRERGELNNNNVPTMVENYFYEMNVVIHELSRVLNKHGRVYMVNDNVQYNGEEIPVDLILSHFAEQAGLTVKRIWVLPRGKGNSSQQMGLHGRKELRKCIYIWEK